MKILAIITLILMPTITFSQDYQGMSKEDVQKMVQQQTQLMMQLMEKSRSCMQDVEPSKIQEFEQLTNQNEAEINSLCANGKRDEAEAVAISFSIKLKNNPDPAITTMLKCGKLMAEMMPSTEHEKDLANQHVCDENAAHHGEITH